MPVFAWVFILVWLGALGAGTLTYATNRSSDGLAYGAGGAVLGAFWLVGLAAAAFFLRIPRTTVWDDGNGLVVRERWLWGAREERVARADAAAVDFVEEYDSDGDRYFVCRVTTASGRVVNVAEGHQRVAILETHQRLQAAVAGDAGRGDNTGVRIRLGGLAVAFVLTGPLLASGQSQMQALLATVHDDASLVAVSRRLFYQVPRDVPALRLALESPVPHVRWAAAMTLVNNGLVPDLPERAVPVLVEAIRDGGDETRALAFDRLGDLGSYKHYADVCAPVVDEAVVAGLRHESSTIRYRAMLALSGCPALPVAVAAREIAAGRGGAPLILNLSRHGAEAKPAAAALIAALSDEHWDVRVAAAQALRAADVAPALYVPAILDELGRHDRDPAPDLDRLHAADRLLAVSSVAAPWAPDVIRLLQSEPNAFIRRQLRAALTAMGTPEAARAAASDARDEWIVGAGPMIFVAVTAVVTSVLLVRSGWAVLLGFLFPAVSTMLAAGMFGADRYGFALQMAAFLGAPVLSLAGAVIAFVSAKRADSAHQRTLGLVGAAVAALVTAGQVLTIVALFFVFSTMGRG